MLSPLYSTRRHALRAVALTQGGCAALQVLTCMALPFLFSPTDVGIYFTVLTLIHLMVTLGTLGHEPLIEGSYGSAEGVFDRGVLLGWVLPRRLLLAVGAGIVGWGLMAFIPHTPPGVAGIVVIAWIRIFGDTSFQILVSVHQPLRALAGTVARLGVRLPVLYLGYLWNGWGGILVGLGIVELSVALWGAYLARNEWRRPLRGNSPPAWFLFALGSGLSTLVLVPFLKAPILAVAHLGTAEQVAHFGIAWQIGVLLIQTNFVFCRTQLPVLRKLAGDPNQFQTLLATQAQATWAFFTGITFTLALLGPTLFETMLGTGYRSVADWLLPSTLTATFLSTAFVLFNGHYALNRSHTVARALGSMTCGAILLIALTYPRFGPTAIPWGMTVASAGALLWVGCRAPRLGSAPLLLPFLALVVADAGFLSATSNFSIGWRVVGFWVGHAALSLGLFRQFSRSRTRNPAVVHG